jgi:photosystem II stability/assembly factor-like uncharacterized protein
MVDPHIGYLLTDKLYKTIDGGITWAHVPSFGDFTTFVTTSLFTGNLIGFSNPDVGIIINYDNADWKKTMDGGTTWSILDRPIYWSNGICAMNNDVYYVCSADGWFSTGGCFVTDDAGESWKRQCGGNYGRDIAMATDSIGYYLAQDNYGSGLNFIYRTNHGGWMWTGVDEYAATTIDYYKLSPNPVTDQISVNAGRAIPTGKVLFEIKDLNGRSIKTTELISGNTTIAVADLAEGAYFYEIFIAGRPIQKGRFVKR